MVNPRTEAAIEKEPSKAQGNTPIFRMLGPKTEDISKINAEVNQIVNQRFTLTTLAITVFGVMLGWLISKDPPPANSPLGVLIFGGTILLTAILFGLFLLSHQLAMMLRVFTSYLDKSGASNWEKDWAHYRSNFSYLGYTKPQAFIFLLLGVFAGAFPFLLAAAYDVPAEPLGIAWVCRVVSGIYLVLVWGMGFKRWFINEDAIKNTWKDLTPTK